MGAEAWVRKCVVGALAAAGAMALGQNGGAGARAPREIVSSGSVAPGNFAAGAGNEMVREIDDPATGDRWLLERDASHPGGPGRLVLAARGGAMGVRRSAGALPAGVRQSPVIRAGQRLIVEENTPVVEARLEAVALMNAGKGSALNVRLMIGGRVVRAVALGPGRAQLAPQQGARP